MATIFYGVAGEGRGHAARALAVIEALSDAHRLVVYANGHAHEMLEPSCAERGIPTLRTPEVAFRYTRGGRLSYVRTGLGNSHYLETLGALVRSASAHIDACAPDLVISDFEPILPRAARRVGVPFVSLSHQHFLLACDLAGLPWKLRTYALLMSPFVSWWYEGQAETIVSSFFKAPIKGSWRAHATHVGVLLRSELRRTSPEDRGHLVAYVRRNIGRNVVDALASCGRRVKVYGLGEAAPVGSLSFHGIDARRFLEDLATCSGLVTTAGNQLVGEALYLGKAVLAMPEDGNCEQEINAFYLERTGAGVSLPMEQLDAQMLRRFVADAPRLAQHLDRTALDGLPAALERIGVHLAAGLQKEKSCNVPMPMPARFGAIGSSPATFLAS